MTQTSTGKATFLLLALLTAFPPLSTDMYLPAIPLLQEMWQVPFATVNLTLVCFFVAYCVFLLVYGPLSDRFGRRPPLLCGIGVYVLASLLCAVSGNVHALIGFRILQAAGAASSSAIALAICKDLYAGHERERILAIIGVLMALAPMLAPVLGSWIMLVAAWRWIFVVQAMVGLIGWVGVWRMPETLKVPSTTGALETLTTYVHVLSNRRYLVLVLLFSILGVPHFSFIGSSSEIYINGFNLSEQSFGYFFAFNALAFMSGSFVFMRLRRVIHSGRLLTMCFVGLGCAGLLMYLGLFPGPWRLAIPMAMASFFYGMSRPPSSNLMLEQVDEHVGAASSLMVFLLFMVGATSMWSISLDWPDKVTVIGLSAVILGAGVLTVWMLLPRKVFFRETQKKTSV